MTTFNNDSLKGELGSDFIKRNDLVARWGMTISSFLAIPGLVGFWPMSSVQRSTGNAYDISGQGRTLTYNGNPLYKIYNSMVPYIDFDGTGDYLSRADETDLDILGNETRYNSPGLTMGGWFREDTLSSFRGIIGKWTDAGDQRSYLLFSDDGILKGAISSTGVNNIQVTHGIALVPGAWAFLVYRYIPSTTLSVYHLSTATTTGAHYSAGIPASIFNSTAPFEIGSYDVAFGAFDGGATLCFLSANALQEAQILALFHQSRSLFGI